MNIYATFVDTLNKNRYLHSTIQVRQGIAPARKLWRLRGARQQSKEAERIQDFSP